MYEIYLNKLLCFVPSLVEIDQVVLDKDILNQSFTFDNLPLNNSISLPVRN